MSTFISEFTNSLLLLQLIYGCFLGLILIQVIGLIRCAQILYKSGTLKELRMFMDEYWQWSHLRQNSLLLSLWVSSCAAYLTTWVMTSQLSDIALITAATHSPIALTYIGIGTLCLFVYTLSKANEQVESTRLIAKRLKQMRLYTSFKSVLKKVRQSPINNSSWGMWIGAMASTTEWLSERWIKKQIDSEMKDAIMSFSLHSALEYMFRMSLVAVTIWIIYR